MSKLAEEIVDTILYHSGPGICTWGDNFPEAHKDLFTFREDMIQDVNDCLEANLKGEQ